MSVAVNNFQYYIYTFVTFSKLNKQNIPCHPDLYCPYLYTALSTPNVSVQSTRAPEFLLSVTFSFGKYSHDSFFCFSVTILLRHRLPISTVFGVTARIVKTRSLWPRVSKFKELFAHCLAIKAPVIIQLQAAGFGCGQKHHLCDVIFTDSDT